MTQALYDTQDLKKKPVKKAPQIKGLRKTLKDQSKDEPSKSLEE